MNRDEIMTLQLVCIEQRNRQILAVSRAVDKLLYESEVSNPPEGIAIPRWIAMINHVLKNGLPCCARYVINQ